MRLVDVGRATTAGRVLHLRWDVLRVWRVIHGCLLGANRFTCRASGQSQRASSDADASTSTAIHNRRRPASGTATSDAASIASREPSAYTTSPRTLVARRRIERARVE